MTSKERVCAAIEFQTPDRIPLKRDGGDWRNPQDEARYPTDIIHEAPGWYREGTLPGRNTDNWGCQWNNLHAHALGQVVGHPLADDGQLESYAWPDADALDLTDAQAVCEHRGDKYVLLGYISLFERLIHLRGFERLLIDCALREDIFFRMRDNVLRYNLRLIDRLLAFNPDAVFLADDWGSQLSLLINPADWRELFLPAYRDMVHKIKTAGKHVFFHSDGAVMDILGDLTKAGVNVFWVEFGVNPIGRLREAAEGKAAFLSLYDTQMLETATQAELDAHIQSCVETLADQRGGFIAQYDAGGKEFDGRHYT